MATFIVAPLGASAQLALLWAAAISVGALSRLVSRLLAIPAVVLLLVGGLLAGRQGLGLIEPLDLGPGLETAVELLVGLVLFEGGLSLQVPDSLLGRRLRKLVLFGLPVTLVGGLVMAHYWAQLSWELAALFSAVVSATGPTVIAPLVRQMGLQRPMAKLLEGEGLLVEPIAAVGALVVLQWILEPFAPNYGLLVVDLLSRLGLGSLLGGLGGGLLSLILWSLPDEPTDSVRLQLCLGALMMLSVGCEQLIGPAAGLPAAAVAGFVVGSLLESRLGGLETELNQLAQLAVTLLFPLLAADVTLSDFVPLGWRGVVCVLGLMLVVRPLAVILGSIGSGLSWPQKIFLGWMAPRGIVSASTASLFALRLEDAGILGASRVQGLVFLTILMTVILNGLIAPLLAHWLQLTEGLPAAGDHPPLPRGEAPRRATDPGHAGAPEGPLEPPSSPPLS
ncbi:MAG TPA: sodium:proton antiporter [Synechococcus sp. UBA8638]|nr:sodium:proton antiporter [Synechococcus sp. UBA8638]